MTTGPTVKDYRLGILGKGIESVKLQELGRIRAGIKILKKGYTPRDEEIYNRMVAEGEGWDSIERALGPDKDNKSKLRPANEEYFTLRKIDCRVNIGNAERLHKFYDDEDGQIRRLPVLFPHNDWFQNIPHGYKEYNGKGELVHQSQYVPVRNEITGVYEYARMCTVPSPRKKDARGNWLKPSGGRDDRIAIGPCVPDNCEDYQKGRCVFKGEIHCRIPGAVGAGEWIIESRSIYSFLQMASVMNGVASRTRGVIADLKQRDFETDKLLLDEHGNVKPVFYLVKVKDTISRFDTGKGESTQTDQYLIYLELDIDETMLEVQYEERARLMRGEKAVGVLAPGTKAIESGNVIETTVTVESEPEKADEGTDTTASGTGAQEPERATVPEKETEPPQQDKQPPSGRREANKAQRAAIKAMALKYGVEERAIDEYFKTMDYDAAVKAISDLNKGEYGFFTKAAA